MAASTSHRSVLCLATPLLAILVLLPITASVGRAQVGLTIGNDQTLATGPSPLDNCIRLRAALDAITDSSVDNPYVVRLPAALYDCGDPAVDPVEVPPHVALVGAGVGQTRIVGSRDDEFSVGLVDLSEGSALSALSVQNSGAPTATVVVGVSIVGATGARLTDTSVLAGDVTFGGFSCALFIEGGEAFVQTSSLFGGTDVATVEDVIAGPEGVLLVAGSQLAVGDSSELVFGSGRRKCVGSYDADLDPILASCEPP